MFPGPNAIVFRNEAGETIGWDYPVDEDQFIPDEFDMDREVKFFCRCGVRFWADTDDDILIHHETCDEPEWLRKQFVDIEFPE